MKTQTSATHPCSALSSALALMDCGPRRVADPVEWIKAATNMTNHCEGTEDVDEAALRIVVTEYRRTLAGIKSINQSL